MLRAEQAEKGVVLDIRAKFSREMSKNLLLIRLSENGINCLVRQSLLYQKWSSKKTDWLMIKNHYIIC